MLEEIGAVAGAIWHALDVNGEMTMAKLKKEVQAEGLLFDWAVGWLAREDKITLTREKRTFRVCLKGRDTQKANAAERAGVRKAEPGSHVTLSGNAYSK